MGLFSYFSGKKFIKRKDSDAGEAGSVSVTLTPLSPYLCKMKQNCVFFDDSFLGRALEELRSSLYNELRASDASRRQPNTDLRTADGAKRLQQRLCGPFPAMLFNFLVAVGLILINKSVMVDFHFPIFLTLIHYVFAWMLLAILRVFSLLPASPPAKATPFSKLFALGMVMSFASGLANTSLKHNSVGFYQMAKIAVTPTIVLAEFTLFRKTISSNKVIALIVVSAGVAVANVTDLEFNIFGACVAVVWVIPSAINKILWSDLQQEGNWTALALMWKTTPITVFFLVVLMQWLDPPGASSFQWDYYNSFAILVSALFGFLLQLSGALALGATSATSHVVLGQFKTCVILLGGYLLFNSDPGFTSICGSVVALCGMSVYTYLGLKASVESPANMQLPSLKPKSVDDQTQEPDTNIVTSDAV